MRIDLHPVGDVASYLILDPSTCPDLWTTQRSDLDVVQEKIDRGVKAGIILSYNHLWRTGVSFRIYVNEEPPAYLVNNSRQTLAGSILNVPGGHLCAVVAIENRSRNSLLGPKPEVPGSLAVSSKTAIPAGCYALDAYELTSRADTAFNSEYGSENVAIYESIMLQRIMVILLTAAVVLVYELLFRRRHGQEGMGASLFDLTAGDQTNFIIFSLMVLVPSWVWVLIQNNFQRVRAALKLRRILVSEWPDEVITLRSIPTVPRSFTDAVVDYQ